jgi:phosphomannomutase
MDLAELRARGQRWIADDPDPATQAELRALLAQADLASTDLLDRFAGSLEFGTAGLRGVLGAGPNRMNRAVVAQATWGLAQEILASVPNAQERGVVVGGDARRMSREFSEDVTAILAQTGLRVLLFSAPVPTPLVGFAVKRLGSAAGVVITASHNPPEYNGYKVYWENAAQIVPPVDSRIAAAIARAPPARSITRPPLDPLRADGRVKGPPEDLERAYLAELRKVAVHPSAGDRGLSIVYTPLHGVGDSLAREALRQAGFVSVTSVPEQQKPDGAFPTVAFPNPEEPGAMDLAFALAKRTRADLVLANDPDADRLAVAAAQPSGHQQLTGNEVGVLLGHYLLTEKPLDTPPPVRGRAILVSIVSSPLLGRIATDLGVYYEETLTGFKWITNRAIELERQGYEFVFGYEEALGYCVDSVVRDKDGISAALLAAELAAVLRSRGLTLFDQLDAISRRWGLFASAQVNVTRKGQTGMAAIRGMMTALRASAPGHVGDDEVVAVSDYETRVRTDRRSAHTVALSLPKSNVLAYELASGSRIIARPSGTEPKAKFYFDVLERVRETESVSQARERAASKLERLKMAFQTVSRL